MKTRIFTLIVSLFIATMAFAYDVQYNVQIDGIYYDLDKENKTAVVSSSSDNYSGVTTITIPSSVTYNSVTYSVTSIEISAFKGCSSLTSITIPNSVTSIESFAFKGCSSLTSITIPEGVTIIGSETFKDCKSLKSIEIPNSVTMIGGYAFEGCSSLTSITIPEGVTEIGVYAFNSCKSLKSIEIPNSVTKIGNSAFASSGIKSIKLGANVTFGGTHVFHECKSLTDIHWNIKNHPDFYDGENLFYSSSYYSFDIRKSIKTFTFGDSVKYIPGRLCNNLSNLTSVTISNSVTEIGYNAFEGCSSLTSITIPDSVTSIGYYAFSDCSSLASINIPNGVTTIKDGTFGYCSKLTSITIPNSVTSIEDYAFRFTQLKELVIEATNPPSLSNVAFWECIYSKKNATVKVPCSSISTYQTTEGWKDFTNFVGVGLPPLLTINVNDASMGVAAITKQNSCEDNIAQVEAKANVGYKFVRWSDGNTENPRKITVTEDMTLTAEFAIDQYQVTLKSNGNGSVTGSGTYDYGTKVTIEAIADKGYHFEKWSDGNTENPRTITVTEDIELSATFELDETPVENVQITSANVYSRDGRLHVEGAETDYYVLDMAGRLVYSGRDVEVQLPRGVYLVTIKGEVQKIVL